MHLHLAFSYVHLAFAPLPHAESNKIKLPTPPEFPRNLHLLIFQESPPVQFFRN